MSIYEYDEEKHLRMEREQSYIEGMEAGMNRWNQLIIKLSELGRYEDITKAASNREYQKNYLKSLNYKKQPMISYIQSILFI